MAVQERGGGETMATLYLVSVEGEVGKTTVALGLALRAREHGLKVGYMKPVGTRITATGGRLTETDASFVKQALGQEEPVDVISPVLLTEVVRRQAIEGKGIDAPAAIKAAFRRISRGRDLVVMEGPPTTRQGITLDVEPAKVAEITDAKVVVILRGEYQLSAEAALLAQDTFGKRLIGAVINSAPPDTVLDARTYFGPFLERHGLELYGVLPRDPVLGAISVADLASLLSGRILCCPQLEGVLVESYIVGAMGAEAAHRYFMHQANKAVITGGDRTDVILAALDTPTRCIILTGNLTPDPIAVSKAMDRQIPLLLVPFDTLETVRRIDEARGPVRTGAPQQMERLKEIVRQEVNFDALMARLGARARQS